jgi:hypothetical protein
MDVQYNSNLPIDPLLNSFTTLFMQDNFMKLYENQFIMAGWDKNVNTKWKTGLTASYSSRKELQNNTDFTFIKYHNRGYTENIPFNQEYEENRAYGDDLRSRFLMSAKIEFKPWQKLYIKNGKKHLQQNSSPLFWVNFEQTIFPNAVNSDYNKLQFGYQHYIKIKGDRRFRINGLIGTSLVKPKNFVDFNHFMGNESPFVKSNPANQFRMLSYYNHSTAGDFASVLMNYEFRKLALTQLFFVRMSGLKENLFVNYLHTGYDDLNYVEMGYSLNNIFRMFRVEVVTNNQNTPFTNWAVRIGLTTNFANSFGD